MSIPIPIVHHPFEFNIFGFALTGFGIAVLLAFLISQLISERELARRGHLRESAAVSDLLFAAVIGTLLGAKLYYVIVITHRPADFFSRGGFVFWGGFIGAVVVCSTMVRVKRLPFWRITEVAALSIAAGYSIGRTGCWAVGDDYGRPWNGLGSVVFPNGSPPSTVMYMQADFHVQFPPNVSPLQLVSVIPTQLIEVALAFCMFLILWRLRTHTHREGWLAGVWCLLAGFERFLIEFLRVKDDRFATLAGLSMAQMISIAVMIVGFVIVARFRHADSSTTMAMATPLS